MEDYIYIKFQNEIYEEFEDNIYKDIEYDNDLNFLLNEIYNINIYYIYRKIELEHNK